MSNVLMLGWEFPPLFSGGLGIATYGMVKAMAKRANIRLIVPNAGPSPGLEDVSISGLNKLTREEINLERLAHSLAALGVDVSKLPVTLSPYHHTNEMISRSERDYFEKLLSGMGGVENIHAIFSGKEVYGPNIFEKISLYTHLAAELAKGSKFDVIHAHDWITFPGGVKIKSDSGKPLILHIHSLETDRSGSDCRNRIYYLEREAMLAADRIIAVSQYTKDQIVLHYQIDPMKISVVHNGIDPQETKRTAHKLKDKLVVFLGRLTHQKGPDFLIETAEKVVRVYPRVKFVVAGTGDQFSHALQSSAYKKLGRKFIFTGFLSKAKVNQLLSMADVYFLPSVSEPFGLSVLEAAQFKVPSVISRQSGAAEVMKGTLQADFWDTDKYANYIHALLKYGVLKKELVAKTQGELGLLTWKNAAEKILEIYDKLGVN
ncbi:MAG TPA: glycosyltransferase family 4 protein [Cyclobacteriaceae bacterium]|nr:glycosyltransferase family 4 protein [Cyclobacteriaceae bacterium]